MAPGATKLGSADSAIFAAQTMLESRECCQAGFSSREYGVMPRKCVKICSPSALNSVASGPNGFQL